MAPSRGEEEGRSLDASVQACRTLVVIGDRLNSKVAGGVRCGMEKDIDVVGFVDGAQRFMPLRSSGQTRDGTCSSIWILGFLELGSQVADGGGRLPWQWREEEWMGTREGVSSVEPIH